MSNKKLTPGRIQKLLKNPGTRAALADKYLTPAQRAERAKNARLNAPVVQGSSLTNRDLAHQRQNATQLQYGPQDQALQQQIAASKQTEADTAGWYDAYLKDLQAHQANIQATNDAAVTQARGLVGAAGQQTAFAGSPSAQNAQDAQQAAAIRQQYAAGLGGLTVAQGASANRYADTLSHVVGPTQKLSALAQGRRNTRSVTDQKSALDAQKAAFAQKFVSDAVASEAKNVLAQKALGLNETKANNTATNSAGAEGRKYGYTPSEWVGMSSSKRASIVKANRSKASGPDLGKVNQYGYTDAQWRRMSVSHRQRIIKDSKAGKPTGSQGPEWLTPNEMSAGITQLPKLKDFAGRAKSGQPFIAGHKPQPRLSRADAAKKIFSAAPSLKDPVLLSAALDAVYDGHLSPETVRRLIGAGYKPSRVAQTLGVPTVGQAKAPRYKPAKGA